MRLLPCCTKFQPYISSRLRVVVVWKVESRVLAHKHKPRRQLKITFQRFTRRKPILSTLTLRSRKKNFFSQKQADDRNLLAPFSRAYHSFLSPRFCEDNKDRLVKDLWSVSNTDSFTRKNSSNFFLFASCYKCSGIMTKKKPSSRKRLTIMRKSGDVSSFGRNLSILLLVANEKKG